MVGVSGFEPPTSSSRTHFFGGKAQTICGVFRYAKPHEMPVFIGLYAPAKIYACLRGQVGYILFSGHGAVTVNCPY